MSIKVEKIIDNYFLNEEYIPRKKRTSISRISPYTCYPETKEELKEIIIERINEKGPTCNLNDINVSNITDMSHLFSANKFIEDDNKINDNQELFKDFNGDISQWDVSNVKNMMGMFHYCEKFNCDLSMWDVSNVRYMNFIFLGCKIFDCNLSNWDVSNVIRMNQMFYGCKEFNCDLSRWNMSNVKDIYSMFEGCKNFYQNLDSWDISNIENMKYAFENCPTTPKWYDRDKQEPYIF